MAKLSLTATDRVMLEGLYPKEGDMKTIEMIKDMRGKVGLSVEEMEAIELRGEAGRTIWNPLKADELVKEVEFSGAEMTLLEEKIEELNKAKKITENLHGVCKKIREGGKELEKVKGKD